jgi:small subunit ribosomal protein S5
MARQSRLPKEEKQYDERVLSIDRVARVVKGGRRFRFRALVVIGDGKGKVGVGVAKGVDVVTSITKSTNIAKKNMVDIALYNGTIPHEQTAQIAGAKILLKPAAPGTGLISGGVVRIVLEVAGVQNALTKSLGSNNKINLAYATVEALSSILPKEKWHTSKLDNKGKFDIKVTPTTSKPVKKSSPKTELPKKNDKKVKNEV